LTRFFSPKKNPRCRTVGLQNRAIKNLKDQHDGGKFKEQRNTNKFERATQTRPKKIKKQKKNNLAIPS